MALSVRQHLWNGPESWTWRMCECVCVCVPSYMHVSCICVHMDKQGFVYYRPDVFVCVCVWAHMYSTYRSVHMYVHVLNTCTRVCLKCVITLVSSLHVCAHYMYVRCMTGVFHACWQVQ